MTPTTEYDQAMDWLDNLDPATTPAQSVPAELAHVGQAAWAEHEADDKLKLAVKTARKCGRTWTEIARIMGASEQAVRQRFIDS